MSSLDVTKFNSPEEYANALVAAAADQARKTALAEWAAAESRRKLATLHKEVGFDSVKELIDALREFLPAGARKSSGEAAPKKEKAAGKRTRTTITDDIRAKVKELAAAGKKAPSIAKEIGISSPSVYNILKA